MCLTSHRRGRMHGNMIISGAYASNSPAPTDPGALAVERVEVSVPARLHLGFVDLNGGLGRRFGSLGIALDTPQTRLTLRRGDRTFAEGPGATRALGHLTEIGRASCRDRVCQYVSISVGAGSLKKKLHDRISTLTHINLT